MSLSPPPNKPQTSNFEVSDELCRDETRNIMYYLILNGKFPPYYMKALCNVFGSDKKTAKAYITSKWLIRLKKLLNSLTCINRIKNKSPVETCIQRNIAQSLSPSPSNNFITSHSDQSCRDETRVIMYFLKMNRKFPNYYVEALCNVLGDDKKEVKEYIIKRWLDHSKKFIDSLACVSL